MRGRAYTRHHDQRKKRKVRHYFVYTDTPRAAGMMARTPKPCSCFMCGNPRRHFGQRSVQERRMLAMTVSDG